MHTVAYLYHVILNHQLFIATCSDVIRDEPILLFSHLFFFSAILFFLAYYAQYFARSCNIFLAMAIIYLNTMQKCTDCSIWVYFNASDNMKQSFGRGCPALYYFILLYFILSMAIVAKYVSARICSYYASILLFAFAFAFAFLFF